MTLAGLLGTLAVPLVRKVLTALGFGLISYAAVQGAFDAAKSAFLGAYGSINADIVWFIELAGIQTAAGIILGAMAARLSLMVLKKLGMVAA